MDEHQRIVLATIRDVKLPNKDLSDDQQIVATIRPFPHYWNPQS